MQAHSDHDPEGQSSTGVNDAPLTSVPRVRWFQGQALEVNDFRDFDASHRVARERDRRHFHGYGIAADIDAPALRLRNDAAAPWTLWLNPGLAFNASGQSLVVSRPLSLELSSAALGALAAERILVCLVPRSEAFDFREIDSSDTLESARILEAAALLLTTRCPDDGLELARLERWSVADQAPRVAPQGRRAEAGEWDQSHAPRCRVERALSESQSRRLSAALAATREALARRRGDPLISELRSLLRSQEAALCFGCGASSQWRQSLELMRELVLEMQGDGLGSKAAISDAIETLNETLKRSWIDPEKGIACYEELADHLVVALEAARQPDSALQSYLELAEPIPVEDELAACSTMPESVLIKGRSFELCDEVECGPEGWPEALQLPEATEPRIETLSTSDGSVRTARGFTLGSGGVTWRASALSPGRDLVLVARVDGRQDREPWRIEVDGVEVGSWAGAAGRMEGWRNETFFVSGELVQGEQVSIELYARHGLEIYGLWAYQANYGAEAPD